MGKPTREVSGFYPKAQILLVQVVKFKAPASNHSTLSTRSMSLKLRIRIRRCLEWNLMQKPHDGAQEREQLSVRFQPIVLPFSPSSPFAFLPLVLSPRDTSLPKTFPWSFSHFMSRSCFHYSAFLDIYLSTFTVFLQICTYSCKFFLCVCV